TNLGGLSRKLLRAVPSIAVLRYALVPLHVKLKKPELCSGFFMPARKWFLGCKIYLALNISILASK
ncbi:MAG: hypothetical protein ACI843_001382, partial [Psychrobacter glaciei]